MPMIQDHGNEGTKGHGVDHELPKCSRGSSKNEDANPDYAARKAFVEIVLASPAQKKSRTWLGSMKGEMKILGDIVAPASDENDSKAQQNSRSRKR
ncbi:MAG TPA: hypothetical protein VFA68_00685 [Terriglobales bacterium]|nr:hypothetical protein [Terriglobales bacterium]